MKIAGKKDLAACRTEARAAVDKIMLPRITEAMGPKFALYQAKGFDARLFGNNDEETAEIERRYVELVKSIAVIENERQAIQARIDSAQTAAEIDAIVAAI